VLFAASPTPLRAAEPPVSYSKQIAPIFTATCVGCHQPEKKKGALDMSTHGALMAGAMGEPVVVAGQPAKSKLVAMISGDDPEMPEKGDPLSRQQVELIARWIQEGAKNDAPAAAPAQAGPAAQPGPSPLSEPPKYAALPVITTLEFAPDGSVLAVSGYSEVLLHKPDGSKLIGRLVGGAPHIQSMVFSSDSKRLAVTGGAPAQYGNLQVWDITDKRLVGNYRSSRDTLYGVSFSPDGQKIAFGCADKSARVVATSSGQELLRLDQHSDWCLGTLFTLDGKRLVTGSRDQALKLIDASNGQLIDDINNPLDAVLAMARHPKEDVLLYGGAMGSARIYRISDNQKRTSGRNDVNRLREFERQPGPVQAVAYSPDGSKVVLGSVGEARLYDAKDGKRLATLGGHGGAVFAAAFSPDGARVATGGFDGQVRIFDVKDGKLLNAFVPVPLEK
jgi:WD40 repeat protein/mono/diheme cytochrome c family protein